jgi:hypothetical protein
LPAGHDPFDLDMFGGKQVENLLFGALARNSLEEIAVCFFHRRLVSLGGHRQSSAGRDKFGKALLRIVSATTGSLFFARVSLLVDWKQILIK